MVIGDLVAANARNYPNKTGLVDDFGTRFTWSEFDGRVNRLSNALLAQGLQKGDRIAILSENSCQFCEFIFAAAKSGLIGVALNARLRGRQLLPIIEDCEPKVVFVQSNYADTIKSISPNLKGVRLLVGIGENHGYSNDYETMVTKYPSDECKVEVHDDDIHLIVYSTGTSGLPKGVPLTHKQRITACILECLTARLTPEDVVLIGVPLYAMGGQQRLIGASYIGATVVVYARGTEKFPEMVERERVTSASLSPIRVQLIRDYLAACGRKYDLSSLRGIPISGGQACSGEQLKETLDFFGVSLSNKCYGMTEAGSAVTHLLPEEIVRGMRPDATEKERLRLDSVGKPYLNMQIKIVDENGHDVPVGQIGEIVVRGDLIGKGYWKKPELSAEVFREGWYYTKDLGRLDEDGYLYFIRRKDVMIKSGGFFVAPQEVEGVMLNHPAVAEAAVVGMPDPKWGERVVAAVVLKSGCSTNQEEISSYCHKHLAGYQVPKAIYFLAKLPKDPMYNKLQVPELKNILVSEANGNKDR